MCLNPVHIYNKRKDFDSSFDRKTLDVPCGHCWQCVSQKQYDLEIRSVSEFQKILINDGCVFNYTLTYNDEHLPTYLSVPVLSRRDMQLFKKRLKKTFGFRGKDINVQYCGEYGKLKDRPHWHILIYCNYPVEPKFMYEQVKKAWSISHKQKDIFTGKLSYTYDPIGYVGLPCKFVKGKLQAFRSENAILDNVYAIRYCVKYTFKSYNFYTYLYNKFYNVLKSQYNMTDDEIKAFDFPVVDGFKFSDKKDHDLQYVANFFASCYRNFNNLGMSQKDDLNEDYKSITIFRNEKNEYITYPMSHYLKNKLFHINCLNDDKTVFCSRYTKYWLDYMLNNINNLVHKQESFYLCNKDIKINPYYDDTIKPNTHVKDILNQCLAFAGCNLHDYLFHSFVYFGLPALFNTSHEDVFKSVQSRCLPVDYTPNNKGYNIDSRIKTYMPYMTACYNSIIYETYLQSVQKYNERQKVIALEFAKLNKGYKPKYIDCLTFDKFINLKSLTINEIKKNF